MGYGVTLEPLSAGGVACTWIIPPGSPSDQVVLYLHGGGFVYGQTPPHLQMGAYLAHKTGARILMVDYRLAPKHPFPSALEDCITAYHWLLQQGIPARNIAVAGDSVGGNLTLTTLLKLRDEGTPLPSAAVCLSPVTDLSNKSEMRPAIKDPLLPAKAVKFYN
jgi:monoterpene epsilon-lactone hydrolase